MTTRRQFPATAIASEGPAPGALDWQPSEGPACDIRWLVHVCERGGKTFRGRTVPRHLYPLSVKLAHAVSEIGLRRQEILQAVSTLCRYRWRTLCLRPAHRSVSQYPHLLTTGESGSLSRDYTKLLGEPYVSQAKVAAFGLMCLDRAAAHADRGNIARAGCYTNNATTVVDILTKPSPRTMENADLGTRHRRVQQEKARRPRSPEFDAVFVKLLSSKYADWRNKELWDELIGLNDETGIAIAEEENGLRLRWVDQNSSRSGNLTYKSFEAKLAAMRSAQGKLKRRRKKKLV